jgi:D-glycero-D-manno-heptose 1,7-bisphosphate phosphatase
VGRPDGVGIDRAVFVDRDGVINRAVVRDGRPFAPRSLADFEILPGVVEAVGRLRGAGFRVIVATNQPDVATGAQTRAIIEAMHLELRHRVAVDDVRVCYHTDADGCECRKPKPGLLLAAAREWNVRLDHSFMVGDRWRDIAAGKAAGCRTILVRGGYTERAADEPDAVVNSLAEAGTLILAAGRERLTGGP